MSELPAKAKRTERFFIEVEYEVWEEAGLDRLALLHAIFDALPTIIPDENGGEGAALQEASNRDSLSDSIRSQAIGEIRERLLDDENIGFFSTIGPFARLHPEELRDGLTAMLAALDAAQKGDGDG